MLMEIDCQNKEAFYPYVYEHLHDVMDKEPYLSIGAVIKNHTCGTVVVKKEGYLWTIQSIFVDPDVQGYGIGSQLVSNIVERASKANCKAVYADYEVARGEISGMDAVFSKKNFRIEILGQNYGITVANGKETDFFAKSLNNYKKPHEIVDFQDLTDEQKYALLYDSKIPDFLNYTCCSDITRFDLSKAYVLNGNVKAYILVFEPEEGCLELGAAYTDPNCKGAFLPLLKAMGADIVDKGFPGDTLFRLTAIGSTAQGLTKKILGIKCLLSERKRAVYLIDGSFQFFDIP